MCGDDRPKRYREISSLSDDRKIKNNVSSYRSRHDSKKRFTYGDSDLKKNNDNNNLDYLSRKELMLNDKEENRRHNDTQSNKSCKVIDHQRSNRQDNIDIRNNLKRHDDLFVSCNLSSKYDREEKNQNSDRYNKRQLHRHKHINRQSYSNSPNSNRNQDDLLDRSTICSLLKEQEVQNDRSGSNYNMHRTRQSSLSLSESDQQLSHQKFELHLPKKSTQSYRKKDLMDDKNNGYEALSSRKTLRVYRTDLTHNNKRSTTDQFNNSNKKNTEFFNELHADKTDSHQLKYSTQHRSHLIHSDTNIHSPSSVTDLDREDNTVRNSVKHLKRRYRNKSFDDIPMNKEDKYHLVRHSRDCRRSSLSHDSREHTQTKHSQSSHDSKIIQKKKYRDRDTTRPKPPSRKYKEKQGYDIVHHASDKKHTQQKHMSSQRHNDNNTQTISQNNKLLQMNDDIFSLNDSTRQHISHSPSQHPVLEKNDLQSEDSDTSHNMSSYKASRHIINDKIKHRHKNDHSLTRYASQQRHLHHYRIKHNESQNISDIDEEYAIHRHKKPNLTTYNKRDHYRSCQSDNSIQMSGKKYDSHHRQSQDHLKQYRSKHKYNDKTNVVNDTSPVHTKQYDQTSYQINGTFMSTDTPISDSSHTLDDSIMQETPHQLINDNHEQLYHHNRRHTKSFNNNISSTYPVKEKILESTNETKELQEYAEKKIQRVTAETIGRTGGVYIPPFKLAQLQKVITDTSSVEYQRQSWEALRKSINGLVNKVNIGNIKYLVQELFKENLIRGRGLLARAIIRAQMASPGFTHVYTALVAIINSKLPDVGNIIIRRILLQFRRAYRRNDKIVCSACVKFMGHLVNQKVVHELLALQLAALLLEKLTDDSVELCVGFIQEVGQVLYEISPKGFNAIFERFRGILHEGVIDKRVQYTIEKLFDVHRKKFKDFPGVLPELDLVEEEDQITHDIDLLDSDIKGDEMLNIFKAEDPQIFLESDATWVELSKEILGEENDIEDGSTSEDSEDNNDEIEEDTLGVSSTMTIKDMTEQDIINLRKTIYLTIMSSASFEECVHKLLKLNIKEGCEIEVCTMLIDCSAMERTFQRFFPLQAERLCKLNLIYQECFSECLKRQYETVHRLETNKLRNTAKFFAHLFHRDALPWSLLELFVVTEAATTSASRIFIKIVFQELSEQMGIRELHAKLHEPALAPFLTGIFPIDHPKNIRFSINFFTAIGLGVLTTDLREVLTNIQETSQRVKEKDRRKQSRKNESTSEESSSGSSDSSDSA